MDTQPRQTSIEISECGLRVGPSRLEAKVHGVRRDIPQNPELSYHRRQAHRGVRAANHLSALGSMSDRVGETGVVGGAFSRAASASRSWHGTRADIYALPFVFSLRSGSTFPFASRTNAMWHARYRRHACLRHDDPCRHPDWRGPRSGASRAESPPARLKLLFQPNEEGFEGRPRRPQR